jgi:N-acyl-D-amino-acid deacylase
MTHDLVLRGGLIVDGTGAAPRLGDVAVDAGRIAAVGQVGRDAKEEIDASGCWVTPGFIDPHTHLDAQLCWDPAAAPSNRHGVTTVILGLCGFGVAPCPPEGDEYLLRALEVVEEIPYSCTRKGVPFGWQSWREFRDYLASQPLGVNAAGFVPHSALRYFAMGERARKEAANPEDRERMVAELTDALDAGAVGFATSRGPNHVDGYREPVPSRLADPEELQALVSACTGRIWQINVETKFSHDASALIDEVSTYAEWSRKGGARLTWTPFYAEPGETVWRDVLEHNRRLNESGVSVSPQITAVPITLLLRFDEGSFLTAIPGWQEALRDFFKIGPEKQKARLAEKEVRAAMKVEGIDPKHPLNPDFDYWTFTICPSRPELSGRSLAQAAAEEGLHPVDLLCDQVIRDDLATLIDIPIFNRSSEGVVQFLQDPHTLLGLGDAGAHVMSVTNYRYPTFLLAELVVRSQAIPIELAINRMTEVPARLHGLDDRGILTPGMAADICVIDPERIALGPVEVRHDLPGSAPRLYQPGLGYRAVFVNGRQIIDGDRHTGAAPGEMLRATALGSS